MIDLALTRPRIVGKRRPLMRTLTLVLLLALTALVGCDQKKKPSPTAQAAAKPETMTNLPKLWDFWATWCAPCKELKPTIEALEKEYEGKIEIRSIDVDQSKDLAQKFKVEAIPTLVFLDAKDNELSRIVGLVSKDTIVGRFKTHGFIQ
jgi:thioredoxin 1